MKYLISDAFAQAASPSDASILGILPLLIFLLLVFFLIRRYRRNQRIEVSEHQLSKASSRVSETDDMVDLHSKATKKNQIFISYRRDDSADVTGRIYDRLTEKYGKDSVFKDVDSVPIGTDI